MERGHGLEPCGTVGVPKEGLGEAICEGIASVTAKTPQCWRYQDPGITTKDSSKRHGAGLRLTDKLCVLQMTETEKWSFPRPFEPKR